MLANLSGRVHEVLSAVALADARGVALAVSVSAVRISQPERRGMPRLLGQRRAA